MNKFHSVFLLIFTLFFSTSVVAGDIVTVCPACTSDQSYIATATNASLDDEDLTQAFNKKVLILNTGEDEGRVYSVNFTPEESGFPQQTMVHRLTPTSSEQTMIDEGLVAYAAIDNELSLEHIVPTTEVPSAYDIILYSSRETSVIDHYMN